MGNSFTAEQIADGRGTLSRHGNGRWRARISYYQRGNRRNVSKVFPEEIRTEAQAKRALAAWQRELIAEAANRAEQEEAEERPSWTVPDYVSHVIDDISQAEDSTKSRYRTYQRRIEARFEGLPLADLTAEMIADWQGEMEEEGLSPTTILHAHRVLSQAMKHAAEEDGLIPFNPCKKRAARPPRMRNSYPNALEKEGRGRLLDYLENASYSPVVLAARIAIETGLRRGEVCGLRWKDVDLDGGYIHVRNSIAVRTGGTYEKPPKTGRSVRDIPIMDGLRAVLRRRKQEQDRERLELLDTTLEDLSELYVIGGVDGSYCKPDVLDHEWRALASVLDLKGKEGKRVSFQDLRHTFASAGIAEGADVASISSIMGHSDITTTLRRYTSPDSDATRRTIERHAETLEAERNAAREKREREEAERGHVYYLPNGTEGR